MYQETAKKYNLSEAQVVALTQLREDLGYRLIQKLQVGQAEQYLQQLKRSDDEKELFRAQGALSAIRRLQIQIENIVESAIEESKHE